MSQNANGNEAAPYDSAEGAPPHPNRTMKTEALEAQYSGAESVLEGHANGDGAYVQMPASMSVSTETAVDDAFYDTVVANNPAFMLDVDVDGANDGYISGQEDDTYDSFEVAVGSPSPSP